MIDQVQDILEVSANYRREGYFVTPNEPYFISVCSPTGRVVSVSLTRVCGKDVLPTVHQLVRRHPAITVEDAVLYLYGSAIADEDEE